MTIEAFTPTSPKVIAGTGPYPVSHPYRTGSLIVAVVLDTVRTELTESDYSVAPTESTTTGNITLSTAAAALYAGGTLYITRATDVEQGWLGSAYSREKGIEAQLDWMTLAIQDTQRSLEGAIRVEKTVPPLTPSRNAVMMWSDDETPVPTVGPTADQIAAAQAYAIAAATAAAAANAAADLNIGLEILDQFTYE